MWETKKPPKHHAQQRRFTFCVVGKIPCTDQPSMTSLKLSNILITYTLIKSDTGWNVVWGWKWFAKWPAEVHKPHKPRDRQPSIDRETCVLSEWLTATTRWNRSQTEWRTENLLVIRHWQVAYNLRAEADLSASTQPTAVQAVVNMK